MYKKALAFIMCVAAAAAAVTSCGSRAQQSEGQSSSAVTSEKETASEVANFTAPKEGDTIIIMNIKDYGEVKFRLFRNMPKRDARISSSLPRKATMTALPSTVS